MAKKSLFSKVFGKQDNDCCSMSFEEVSEEATDEVREERAEREDGREEVKAEATEQQEVAGESR